MSTPIRMCISCKMKIPQKDLIRLQCIDGKIIHYIGMGRSFYLCQTCIGNKDKKLVKSLSAKCRKKIDISDLESVI